MITGYLAADGFEEQLAEELRYARIPVSQRLGNLFVTDHDPVVIAWSINTWFDCEWIDISSIGDAAKTLRAKQRNWSFFGFEHRGRGGLITEKLPHVSAKPLQFGQPAPEASLGSFTLATPNLMLVAQRCSSPFPNGQARFVEDNDGPPSRAYLKLWESLALLRAVPIAGQRVADLGASPGGWTWSLAKTGAHVVAVDRAPLDPRVDDLRNVEWRGESAFALMPKTFGQIDWLFSDIIAYPDKIFRLLETWIDTVQNIVCTIKFQGETDYSVAQRFSALSPNARVVHLFHNKHELTFLCLQ
jgi:23S rRNA (cytidine2498-2'-O)-methyltransferase